MQPPPPLSGADSDLRDGLQFDAGRYEANIYALSLIIGTRWPDSQGEPELRLLQAVERPQRPRRSGRRTACARRPTSAPSRATRTRSPPAAPRSRRSTGRRWRRWTRPAASTPTSGRCSPNTCRSSARRRSRCPASTSSPGAPCTRSRTASRTPTGAWTTPTPGHRITSVFNWSSQVRGDLVEAENGHGHETILDDCEDDNPSNADRMRWATEASAALPDRAHHPGDAARRQMRLDAFFADWMTYEAGCSIANEYCDNPVQAWLRASGESMNYDNGGCAMAGRDRRGHRRVRDRRSSAWRR